MTEFLDKLLDIPGIYGLKLSSDGRVVTYSWSNINTNFDVFCVFPDKQENEPVLLTKTDELSMTIGFTPPNDAVIVKEDIKRNERYQLFKVKLDNPLEMEPLTEANPPYFLTGGFLHYDNTTLVFAANYDFDKKEEIDPTYVYKQNLTTKEITLLAKPLKPTYVTLSLNREKGLIIYSRSDIDPNGEQIWMVDIEGKEDREIINMGDKAKVEAFWLGDNKHVIFIADSKFGKKQDYNSIGAYNVETGDITWLVDDSSRNFERLLVPPNDTRFVLLEYIKAKPQCSIFDFDSKSELKIPKVQGNLIPYFPFKDKWIGLYYGSSQPDDIVIFSPKEALPEKFTSLTRVWDKLAIKKEELTQAEEIEWKGKDGKSLHGWLYRPKNPNGKTIVHIHGGPTAHSEDDFYSELQYYTSLGFTVFDPNYRGSTGYGINFRDAIKINGWGKDEQEDILSGIEYLIEQGLAQKGKVGITGTSYGGYSSWWTITHAPTELIAAAAPICGMTDLVVDYHTTRPDLRTYSEEMLGGKPEDVPDIYHERSPINFVQNIKGKLLIIQGAQDPNVTPENVNEVRKKLDENNISYELLVFEDEGHGIIRKKNMKKLFTEIAEFFMKNL